MAAYKGNIKNIDWCNLDVLKPIADFLDSYIGKHPDRENYNIYATLEALEKDGAVRIHPPKGIYDKRNQP